LCSDGTSTPAVTGIATNTARGAGVLTPKVTCRVIGTCHPIDGRPKPTVDWSHAMKVAPS